MIGTTDCFCIEKGHSPLTGKVYKKSEFYSHRSPCWPHLVAENILLAVKFLVSINHLSASWALLGKSLADKQINLPSVCLFMFTVPAVAATQSDSESRLHTQSYLLPRTKARGIGIINTEVPEVRRTDKVEVLIPGALQAAVRVPALRRGASRWVLNQRWGVPRVRTGPVMPGVEGASPRRCP